jgi:hypothetical protein
MIGVANRCLLLSTATIEHSPAALADRPKLVVDTHTTGFAALGGELEVGLCVDGVRFPLQLLERESA